MNLEQLYLTEATQLQQSIKRLHQKRPLTVLSLTPRRFSVNEAIHWYVMPLQPVAYIDELASVLEKRPSGQHLLIEMPPPTQQWQPAHDLLQHLSEVTDA